MTSELEAERERTARVRAVLDGPSTWPADRTQIAECHSCEKQWFHVLGRSNHTCSACGGPLTCGYAGCQPLEPTTLPQAETKPSGAPESPSDARKAELDDLAGLGALLGIHEAQTLLDIGEVARLPLPIQSPQWFPGTAGTHYAGRKLALEAEAETPSAGPTCLYGCGQPESFEFAPYCGPECAAQAANESEDQ